jgi:hypothetical protein
LANFTVLLANKKPHVGLVKAFWWAGFYATMLIVINNEPGRGWGVGGNMDSMWNTQNPSTTMYLI